MVPFLHFFGQLLLGDTCRCLEKVHVSWMVLTNEVTALWIEVAHVQECHVEESNIL